MRASSALRTKLKRVSPRRDVVMVAFGALASWAITHWYQLQPLSDMKAEVEERRRVDDLVFRGIESVGSIRYSRDTTGRVVGVSIQLHGQASVTATATGALSSTPPANAKE